MATTLPHAPIAPTDDLAGEPSYIVDTLFWHCVLAMLVPLWTPVTNTVTVTSFNFDEAFKALEARHGSPIAPPSTAHYLVVLQARRMAEDAHRQAMAEKRRAEESEGLALEAQRVEERLAATEKVRQKRDQEHERRARKEVEDIGYFSL